MPSSLQEALAAVWVGSKTYREALEARFTVSGEGDVAAIAQALATLDLTSPEETAPGSDLFALTQLFQCVANEATARALRQVALPRLIELYDRALEIPGVHPENPMFLLKQFAQYRDREATRRVIAGMRRFPDSALWQVVLSPFEEEHPFLDDLMKAAEAELPGGRAGVAFLELANALSISGRRSSHPFDTPEGIERLQGWLSPEAGGEEGFAVSATCAVPFISEPARSALLATASKHPDPQVRLEAAWAEAKLGKETGFRTLVGAARDPRTAWRPLQYLRELGQEQRIPRESQSEEFLALVEMARWLEHPAEMGRPPHHLELVDSRELFWPPTNDRRRLYVVRYQYDPDEEDETGASGYGLVGSVTFALFDSNTDSNPSELTPLEVYALHCCWELSWNHDPRAPEEQTTEAGMALLAAANPELMN